VPLAGRPMVEWSIAAFRECPSVGAIVVAVPPGASSRQPDIQQGGPADGSTTVVAGGATRAESVSNALALVDTDLVAIHDAARPLVTPELVEGVVATLRADPEAAGAIAATPITDTIKRVKEGVAGSEGNLMPSDAYRVIKTSDVVDSTLDRSRLWAAQTPQVFRVEGLRKALAGDPERVKAATDEAMLVEEVGGRVLIHPAPAENLKVTTRLDLRLAELLLAGAPAGAERRGGARRRG
jgi:2-C-methyl-D-erythritol 4-phosphate cytidylyltransferase